MLISEPYVRVKNFVFFGWIFRWIIKNNSVLVIRLRVSLRFTELVRLTWCGFSPENTVSEGRHSFPPVLHCSSISFITEHFWLYRAQPGTPLPSAQCVTTSKVCLLEASAPRTMSQENFILKVTGEQNSLMNSLISHFFARIPSVSV